MPNASHISSCGVAPTNHRRKIGVWTLRSLAVSSAFAVVLVFLAGCGGDAVTTNSANAIFSISPGSAQIDTNCTGCNTNAAHGAHANQFVAILNSGGAAPVVWSVTGGDPVSGHGIISPAGLYTPPNYLTKDHVQVVVTAALRSNPAVRASATIAITPGFLQPLTPENLAVGAGGTAIITGLLAEAGGSASIHFALRSDATGAKAELGTLSATSCQHARDTFTTCTVTYTAPATISSTHLVHLEASAPDFASSVTTEVLLNTAGVNSNPATHQAPQWSPMLLGSSGSNNNDYDAHGKVIADCCGGTLGALVQNVQGTRFLLSNNHVLARSDQARIGDAIVQPGLIDNNCTPNGDGPGTEPVATLTDWLPLQSAKTNVDAAIAQVESNSVDPAGRILELGAPLPDGNLAAAPPGISSSGGQGEAGALGMRVAKSGRTTGLTCGGISTLGLDVVVDYYHDCAETKPYLTKLFRNQIGVSGDQFSDAGDSGALVVDASNAEPVGLYFAGGVDSAGVDQGVANPAGDVLQELNARAGNGTAFSFVGGADHSVSCLSFGNSTVAEAQAAPLSTGQIARVQTALDSARALVNPSAGILGVAMGKSSDEPGTAAVIVYVNAAGHTTIPAAIQGVRTMVILATARDVALGSAPMANTVSSAPSLSVAALAPALAIKQKLAQNLMASNPAFFGVGVGQSLDDPAQAALVIYVDQQELPDQLPETIGGLRTRYIVMNRLHVTRSYAVPFPAQPRCESHAHGESWSRSAPSVIKSDRKLF